MGSLKLLLVLLLFDSRVDCAYRSCRDHYLQGSFDNGVFEIQQGESYLINCEFPRQNGGLLAVTTIVHSALSKWHLVTKNETVGYQIQNREVLSALIRDSDFCEQTLYVQWQGYEYEAPLLIESVQGVQRVFEKSRRNEEIAINLIGAEAGVLHLFPDLSDFTNQSAYVRSSLLRCSQNVLENPTCLFTFNKEDADGLTVNFFENLTSMEFSFRTDKPTMPFVRVHLDNRPNINVDLIDGYLLTVNHLIHPIKLLADGQWHKFRLLYPQMDIYIDDAKTAIKISAEVNAKIKHVEIAFSGEMTALVLNEKDMVCNDTKLTSVGKISYHSTPNVINDICPAYEENYCNCKAPNSVVAGDLYSRAKCDKGFLKDGYHLSRSPRQLSFFYTTRYHTYATVSVLFKSYADTGLIFFGASEADPSVPGVVKTQVYFENTVMQAAICHPKSDGTEKCRSCSITEPNGFKTSVWTRVSMFNYKDYHYLTVNEKICQLSPEEGYSRVYEIYKLNKPLKDESALFVGGTFYAKSRGPWQYATRVFQDHFREVTKEKPQSLEGCVGEIRINGVRLDLDDVYETQLNSILKEPKTEAFSMTKGCIDCAIAHVNCHGTACLPSPIFDQSKDLPPVCACEDIYTVTDATSGSCRVPQNKAGDTLLSPSILLSHPTAGEVRVYTLPSNRRAKLQRFWMILTFPTENAELKTIIDLTSLTVSVGDYGRQVVIVLDSSIRQEFIVDPFDERAHLLAIKKTPSIGSNEGKATIQLDNEIRQVPNIDFMEYPVENIAIYPIQMPPKGSSRKGCIMDIGISHKMTDGSVPRDNQQVAKQIDWKEYVLYHLQNSEFSYYKSLISLNECGIRDPSLWSRGTTSYGVVGDYDPKGFSLTSPLGAAYSWFWILLTVATIILALILCVCCVFCLCGSTQRKTHGKATKNGMNGSAHHSDYPSDRSVFLETPEPLLDYAAKDSSGIEAPKSPSGTSKAPLVRPEDV
ncbi:hypothetical protein L596_010933 [Steinernema carpocapsae]|uniref:Laminin G domain-containing protein n=1 Tax=Steinernema carpocapsae TaxID=34508 RepID=A0A4U5PL33_STECR|nr:hypothetical protein L596_010933 [Steinernema carpocapsae]